MTRRFGRGEYYALTPDWTEDDPTFEAREFFVRVALDEIPTIREEFEQTVIPLLDQVASTFAQSSDQTHPVEIGMSLVLVRSGADGRDRPDSTTAHMVPQTFSDSPPGTAPRELHESLVRWSDRFNLTANPWFTLRMVCQAEVARRIRLGIHWPGVGPDPALAGAMWDQWIPWLAHDSVGEAKAPAPPEVDLTRMSEAEVRRRVDDYFAAMKEAATVDRTPHRSLHEVHFRWLVRWQLLGESYRTLFERAYPEPPPGRKPGGTQAQVIKAIQRTAELVGLSRRSGLSA